MSSPTSQIAKLLGKDNRQAREFAEAVRSRVNYSIRYIQIVEALKDLGKSERTVARVASMFDIGQVRNTKIKKGEVFNPAWLTKLTDQVQDKLPYPINQDIVQDVVKATNQRDADFIAKYLDKYTPFVLLGTEVGSDAKEAASFCEQAEIQLGYHVKPADILAILEQYKPIDRSHDALVDLLAIDHIGQQLDIKPEQAARLSGRLEKRIGKLARPLEIQQALEQLEGDPRRLGPLVVLLRLANELEFTSKEVRVYLGEVAAELGDDISDNEVLKAVCAMDTGRHQVSELAWQIRINRFVAAVGEMEPEQARHLLEEIDRRLPSRARSAEIDRALDVPGEEAFGIEDIIERIIADRIVDHISAQAYSVDDYRSLVSKHLDRQVNIDEILRAMEHIEADSPLPSEVAAFIEIAGVLALDSYSSSRFILSVRDHSSSDYSLSEIARALSSQEPYQRTPDSVVGYIELSRFVEKNQVKMDPEEIRSWLGARLGREVVYSELQSKLDGLNDWRFPADASHSVSEWVLAYFSLAFALGPMAKEVTNLMDELTKKTNGRLDARLLAKAILEDSRFIQRPSQLVDYIALAHLVEADGSYLKSAAKVVRKIHQQRSIPSLFWRQVGRAGTHRSLSQADLTNLISLTVLPYTTLRLLEPDDSKIRWIREAEVNQMAVRVNRLLDNSQASLTRSPGLVDQKRIDRLLDYRALCWAQVNSGQRLYQVPSEGRAEIEVDDYIGSLLNLIAVRFIAEGARPPALHIQFRFGLFIGAVAVMADGRCQGFHHLSNDKLFRALIDAIAVSYYRDLVLPGEEIESQPTNRRRTTQKGSGKALPKRIIPNPRHRSSRTQKFGAKRDLYEWYKAQERARHYVRGHVRRCQDPNFIADYEKQAQARAHGITLRPGQTWVVEHERGKPRHYGRITLAGYDLVHRTVFRPPVLATAELNSILR